MFNISKYVELKRRGPIPQLQVLSFKPRNPIKSLLLSSRCWLLVFFEFRLKLLQKADTIFSRDFGSRDHGALGRAPLLRGESPILAADLVIGLLKSWEGLAV